MNDSQNYTFTERMKLWNLLPEIESAIYGEIDRIESDISEMEETNKMNDELYSQNTLAKTLVRDIKQHLLESLERMNNSRKSTEAANLIAEIQSTIQNSTFEI